MKFFILHGSFGTPESNWFPQLKEHLEMLGQDVIIPEFPIENWEEILGNPNNKLLNQNLENWLSVFKKYLINIFDDEKICVVAHSLGPVFLLHALVKFQCKIDTAIFVSPFLTLKANKDLLPIDTVNKSFYCKDFDFNKIKSFIDNSYVLYSDNDPYVPRNKSLEFAKKLNSSTIFVKHGGHMNSEINLNEFPLVLELCKASLDYNLYSRFIDYKSILELNILKAYKEKEFYYLPSDISFEGTFHFRNLQKKGFCTFVVGTGLWETQGKYMKEARLATKRVKDITRIFLIKNLKDLDLESFKSQLELDVGSGMKIGFAKYDEAMNITDTPDFGIWDDCYVCIVPSKGNQVGQIHMTSKLKDLEKYYKIKDKIIKLTTWVENNQDIEKFKDNF